MHGEKMSKSKGNIVDPFEAIDRYGSDALRWYLLWSVTPWEDTRFSFDDFGIIHGAVCTLWNAYRFAAKYFELDGFRPGAKPALEAEDRWILSRLEGLTKATTESYEGLNPNSAARLLRDFVVDDLSRSYIKYIRNRLKDFQSPAAGEKKGRNKAGAYWALHRVMERLAIISAPITPFIAEEVYQGLGGKRDSVHLEDWPAFAEQDAKLEQQMSAAARIIEVAANVRNSLGINLRQPLAELWASSGDPGIEEAVAALPGLIADQANVKRAAFGKPQQGDFASAEAGGITVFLPRAAGSDLLREGAVREVVRRIQQMRKEARLVESDRIEVGITAGREFLERLDAGQIARLTNATEVGFVAVTGTKKEWKIGNAAVTISVRKLP
jgi:isoleucyl-tRNA synthetase